MNNMILGSEKINPKVLEQFLKVRKHTEAICEPLRIEDYVPQPVDFVSPAKWHLAHTSWFFEEFILKAHMDDYSIYDEQFNYLFNSYYNNLGTRIVRTDRGNLTRPSVDEVYQYRKHVTDNVLKFFDRGASEEMEALLITGLNHEQQHQELLITDIKYILGHNPSFPVYKEGFSLVNGENQDHGYVEIKEGVYEIGYEGDGFSWDNEHSKHKTYIHSFAMSKGLVTNGEYLEFIEAGGYQNFNLWLDEGWSWVNAGNRKSPLYWHLVDGQWMQFTLGGLQPIQPDHILCHVSFFEAWAYAQWKGHRLPTEFEWEVAADQLDWGQRWEWTNSAYLPYPGFSAAPGALGEYNGKWMVNQKVLRGGSTATPIGHSRKTYRNFFQTHMQWQCMGLRLAIDL